MNTGEASHCLLCSERSGIFKSLGEEQLEQVNRNKVSIRYKAGEMIFKQSTPCYNFVCITSGLVKLYIEHEDDKNLIIGMMRPVNYIFDPGFFVDQQHHVSAMAVEDTTACLVDIQVMKDLVFSNPKFSLDFIHRISRQALSLFDRISSCTHKHVYGKVADALLYLHPRIYPGNPFTLSICRQDLADLSGITKESVIRVLKKFKDDRVITLEGNEMEILDKERLRLISRKG